MERVGRARLPNRRHRFTGLEVGSSPIRSYRTCLVQEIGAEAACSTAVAFARMEEFLDGVRCISGYALTREGTSRTLVTGRTAFGPCTGHRILRSALPVRALHRYERKGSRQVQATGRSTRSHGETGATLPPQ